jgi:hypothetical protein
MDPEPQAVANDRLVDRVVLALAERGARAGVGRDLHDVGMPRPALDLAHRVLGVVVVDRDAALEGAVVVVLIEPVLDEPLVEGRGNRVAVVGIGLDIAERARQHDRVGDAVLVDQLPAKEVGVRALRPATGRHAVEARPVHGVVEHRPSLALVAIAKRHLHVLADLAGTARHRVHVDIDDSVSDARGVFYIL